MESHSSEVQELPPPTPPPLNTIHDPLTAEETKKNYHKGCPGCRLDEANKISTGIPYLNFFFIWIVCLTAGESMSQLFCFFYFLCCAYLVGRRAHKYLRLRLAAKLLCYFLPTRRFDQSLVITRKYKLRHALTKI